MFNPHDVLIAGLIEATSDLAVALRMGDGFDEEKYNRVVNALRQCVHTWKNSSVIPKKLAMSLIEIQPALESSLNRYKGKEADRIWHAIDELYNLSLECCNDESVEN